MPRRLLRLVTLAFALSLPGACTEAPFPACPGQERQPAFCAAEQEGLCGCSDLSLHEDGHVWSTLMAITAPAACRADGSDWEMCDCRRADTPPDACVAACATLRCTEACDQRSVLSCQQVCLDFFDDHTQRHGTPDEDCAEAIATIALCSRHGCMDAPACDEESLWDRADDYVSACDTD